MATKKATPWGKAVLVDEIVVPQKAPGPRSFTTHVQLLETESGERLVRMAYATTAHGWVRRGPVTLRIDYLATLLREVAAHPELAAAFGLNGARPRRPGARGLRRRANPG